MLLRILYWTWTLHVKLQCMEVSGPGTSWPSSLTPHPKTTASIGGSCTWSGRDRQRKPTLLLCFRSVRCSGVLCMLPLPAVEDVSAIWSGTMVSSCTKSRLIDLHYLLLFSSYQSLCLTWTDALWAKWQALWSQRWMTTPTVYLLGDLEICVYTVRNWANDLIPTKNSWSIVVKLVMTVQWRLNTTQCDTSFDTHILHDNILRGNE